MALVPKTLEEFQSEDFWNAFFEARRAEPFEWYCEYEAVQQWLLPDCLSKTVLVPGCGNSEISAKLYDDGVVDIVNLDFSKPVIREMLTKHVRQRPKMKWLVMDVTQMKFGDGSFDVVLDKGALDALMGDSEADSTAKAELYLREVQRVLKDTSVFFCVSLLQRHILKMLLSRFSYGFRVRIQGLEIEAEKQVSEIQPFLFVAERGVGESLPPIAVQIASSVNEMQIRDIQRIVDDENAARLEGRSVFLKDGDLHDFDTLHPGRRLVMESLKSRYSKKLKRSVSFTAVVLDVLGPMSTQCAVYIIPRKQEHSWQYGTVEGQWGVARQCQAQRVILIHLHLYRETEDLDHIKDALSAALLRFIPISVRSLPKATPFLTSEEASKTFCDRATVKSAISGDMVVRDVIHDGRLLRRLMFGENQSLIQSEVALLDNFPQADLSKGPESGGGLGRDKLLDAASLGLDHEHLSAEYHRVIVSGLSGAVSNTKESSPLRVVVIGLGGGVLPAFLARHFTLELLTVELDPATIEVAKEWFGMDASVAVRVGDGIDYVAQQAQEGCLGDVLIVDAGGSDDGSGMTCPPAAFVDTSFLKAARAYLGESGMLVMNVVARSFSAFQGAVAAVRSVFAFVYAVKVDEDVNRVVFASQGQLDFSQDLGKIAKEKWTPSWDAVQTVKGLAPV